MEKRSWKNGDIIEVNMAAITASPMISPKWIKATYRHTNSIGQHYVVPWAHGGGSMSPLYVHDMFTRSEKPEMSKLAIGAVSIRRAGQQSFLGLSGDDRIAALRVFYHTKKPPEGLEAIAFNPTREVLWEDVNWETAGERVTR